MGILILISFLIFPRTAFCENDGSKCDLLRLLFAEKRKSFFSSNIIEIHRKGKITEYWVTRRNLKKIRKIYPKHLVDLQDLQGKKILDGGSGTGAFVIDLRKRGHDITGFDLDLSSTPQQYRHWFKQGDLLSTHLPNQSYDVIYYNYSVFSFEMKRHALIEGILKESDRILKLGGKIRISPLYQHEIDQLQDYLQNVPGLHLPSDSIYPIGESKFAIEVKKRTL